MTKSVCDFQSSKTVRTSESGPRHSNGVPLAFSMERVVRGRAGGSGGDRVSNPGQNPSLRSQKYGLAIIISRNGHPLRHRAPPPPLPSVEPPRPPTMCYWARLVVKSCQGHEKSKELTTHRFWKILFFRSQIFVTPPLPPLPGRGVGWVGDKTFRKI